MMIKAVIVTRIQTHIQVCLSSDIVKMGGRSDE